MVITCIVSEYSFMSRN